MGDAHPLHDHFARSGDRRGRLRSGDHIVRGLVLAQTLERGLTQDAVLGVARVFDLGDQDGLDPVQLVVRLRRDDEGRAFGGDRLQRRRQGFHQGRRIARPDPAQIAQSALGHHPDQQGAETGSAVGRPAADHDLVAASALGLDPGG
ncbi:hypothetical protein D3C86_1289960 [compost metagenome]